MEAPLNIQLSQSPTRQKLWRVVRFGALVVGTWVGLTLLLRMCFAWSDVVPQNDSTHLRIVKSPEVVANLRSVTRGLSVLPGAPYSLSDLTLLSRGVLNIDFAHDGSITVIIDRALTETESRAFRSFGVNVFIRNKETIITNSSVEPSVTHSVIDGVFTTLFQGSDARVFAQGASAPVHFTDTTITLKGLVTLLPPEIERTPTVETLAFTSLSADDLMGLGERVFTQNTPGLSNFFALATHNGLSAIMTESEKGLQYTFASPITEDTRALVNETALRSLAKELTEIPTIEGITNYLDDGSRTTSLRSREEATIVLRDESPYRFLNATASKGTVTITETPTFLTVSNATTFSETYRVPPCLAGTRAFVKPLALQSHFPEKNLYTSRTLSSLLWNAETIASSSSDTRICMHE